MQPLNYASDYQRVLDQEWPYVLYFGELHNPSNNSLFRWENANTIYIPSIMTTGRVDGNRDVVGTAQRRYENNWEPKILTQHRMWDTLVHPADITQTNMVASIGNITRVYNETQKFPEMDAYLVSKVYADWVAQGFTAMEETITSANVLSIFDRIMQQFTEKRTPPTGRLLYVTPEVKTALKQAQEIQRSFDVQSGASVINRTVNSLDQVTIKEVPPELMRTVYDFTVGWTPGTSARQIQMLMVHQQAVIAPKYYTFATLDAPAAINHGKYYYYEEAMEDVFILNNKATSIQFVLAPATP